MSTSNFFAVLTCFLLFMTGGCSNELDESENFAKYIAPIMDAVLGSQVRILDEGGKFELRYYQPDGAPDWARVYFRRSAPDADPKTVEMECPKGDKDCDDIALFIVWEGVIEQPIRRGHMDINGVLVEELEFSGTFWAGATQIGFSAAFTKDLKQITVDTWIYLGGANLILVTVDHVSGDLPEFE